MASQKLPAPRPPSPRPLSPGGPTPSLTAITNAMASVLDQQADKQREMIRSIVHDELARNGSAPPLSPKASPMAQMAAAKRVASTLGLGLRKTVDQTASDKSESGTYTSLQGGDLITLRASENGLKGFVFGSMSERNVSVEADSGSGSEDRGGPSGATSRFGDCVFRICSKLNYRSRTELNMITKAIRQSADPEETKKEMGLEQARVRAHNEAVQNEEALSKLHKGVGFAIKYGDVVQFEHRKSQLFLALHKSPAPVNSNNRKVSLKAGSFAAHFRILPRFKVRSIGSLVYANDEIVLQSVKFDPMVLGASGNPKDMLPSPVARTELGVRLPASLRHGECFEMNGAVQLRSFTVKMYARFGEQEKHSLLTGLHSFRFFHPEGNAFVSASGDANKGEVLDARVPSKQLRARPLPGAVEPVPGHIPYLKIVRGEVSNPANFSAKAVWCFENVDRTTASTVKWRTPLRLRHVPSGKYLSVDSLSPTKLAKQLLSRSTSGVDERKSTESDEGGEENMDSAVLCNASLVHDVDESAKDGAFGSPSSLIFYLVPTDVTSDTLKGGVSTLRLEHHAPAGFTLHFTSPREPKPFLAALSTTDDDHDQEAKSPIAAEVEGHSAVPSRLEALALEKKGGRLLFSSQMSSVDVLKLMPLTSTEGRRIDSVVSRIRLFQLYANRYQSFDAAGTGGERPPTDMCEAVVEQCLAVIDDMRRGSPPPRRHVTVADAMKEANSTLPALFSTFFSGEADPRMQRIAIEVKVLDALFEAALAPYNRALNAARPYQLPPANDQPQALAKFLYVALQRTVWGNVVGQEYLAGRSSRAWFPSPAVDLSPALATPPLAAAVRKWSLWRDIIISQGEDSLGATVTLAQLLGASETIVLKLVSNELMARFKNLIKRCGPEPRLINLFSSICTVAGKPSQSNQEMCVRTLWMNLPDRYGMAVTFHECETAKVPKFGAVAMPNGSICPPPPVNRAPSTAPAAYLGKTKENVYGPVCVAWTSADEWVGDCGKLFWSAKALGIPVVDTLNTGEPDQPPKGGVGKVELVPIECLMWPLNPEMLCEPVTGEKWKPLDESGKRGKNLGRSSSRASMLGSFTTGDSSQLPEKLRAEAFKKQAQLASYVVAQIKLLTQMCTGRSYICINWLERSFSYECLMNMASNPRLPFVFRSAVLDFTRALYVDRFPQLMNSGAPCLPELLWVYDEPQYTGARKSNTPVLQPLTLASEAAFPYFFVPPLSSVARDDNPMLSFPTHFKFFLLRSLTNGIVSSFGENGRIVHSLAALNDLGGAAIRGQQGLLDFGFQSTYEKLKDLCHANAKLLDGRSDLANTNKVFDPPDRRYRQSGGSSAVVTKMKREVIQLFLDVANLRANYRLAKLLYIFKTHSEQIKSEEGKYVEGAVQEDLVKLLNADSQGARASVGSWDTTTKLVGGGRSRLGSAKGEGASYLLGRSDANVKKLYDDFEAMFPGGSEDAAKLDLSVLSNKPDMDQALVDCLMYDDDALMESALALLDRTYGQRRKLLQALQEVTLLPGVAIPVYGDVHSLRSCLNDLLFQARTASSWGVKSRISGPFDDATFGAIMANIDKLLVFLHTSTEPEGVDDGVEGAPSPLSSPDLNAANKAQSKTRPNPRVRNPKKKAGIEMVGVEGTSLDLDDVDVSNFQDSFSETDLQGNFYECRGVWSVDVASKWGKEGSGRSNFGPPQEHHQTILRAINLQTVLVEGLTMDHEIAWKGSICTEREKVESERRLTLVKRALLQLTIAFVYENEKNQESLFGYLDTLQALATPPELQEGSTAAKGFDERRASMKIAAQARRASAAGGSGASGSRLAARVLALNGKGDSGSAAATAAEEDRWPFTVAELSQDLIIQMLRRNEDLCDKRVKRPLIELFASLVDSSADSSAAPTLDLFFILAQPQERPIQDNQTAVAELLLNDKSFPNLAKTVRSVVLPGGGGLAHPSRILQLARVVMENKNEYAASQLMQHANLSIDATCNAIAAIVEEAVDKAENDGKKAQLKLDVEGGSPSSAAAMDVLLGDMGRNLLSLLAEQVNLLPMNAMQVMSESLWGFLGGAAALTLEAFASMQRVMSADELVLCEELFDVLERVLEMLQRLGLLDDALSDERKAVVVSNINDDVSIVLEGRELTPDFLRQAFMDALISSGQKLGLDRDRFKRLVIELEERNQRQTKSRSFGGLSGSFTEGQATSPVVDTGPVRSSSVSVKIAPSPSERLKKASKMLAKKRRREAQLEDAFELADSDGNGVVDLYEFVVLYMKVTKGDVSQVTGLTNEGHELSMRTVECGERIVAMAKGTAQQLHPRTFTRTDKFQPREKKTTKKKSLNGVESSKIIPAAVPTSLDEPALFTLQERLATFKTTVSVNPRILGALQRRRFSMVSVLEEGTPAPPPKVGRALTYKSAATKEQVENPLCSAVAIAWGDVTKRFVSYCTEHFYDEGGAGRATVQLILETWMAHLVKARTLALEEDGTTPAESIAKASVLRQVTPHELSDDRYAAYRAKQVALNSFGVTELLAKIISSLDDISPGGLPDIALDVFIELLNGGCMEAADSLYHFLIRVDTEGKFIQHLGRRLDVGLAKLQDAKARGGFGRDSGGVIGAEMEESCGFAIATTRFLQLVCEGHNIKFQNLLRAQPMYSGQFNLVKKVVEALILLCESTLAVSFFHGVELDMVSQLLALLIELMQGPCPGNQEEIVESETLAAINNIIPAANAFDLEMSVADPGHMDIRGQSCVLLAACLEGREDFDCHHAMTQKLEVSALFGYQALIEDDIRNIRGNALGRLLDSLEGQRVKTLQAALVAVVTVGMELRQEKKELEKAADAAAAVSDELDDDGDGVKSGEEENLETTETSSSVEASGAEKAASSSKAFDRLHSQPLVGIVEVAWKGQIERNVFAMPFEVEYLTPGTKAKFLEEVDLSTTEKRMSELMHSSDVFIAEMRLIHDKAEQSSVFRALHHQMPTFKIYLYVLVMLLNLNIIMSPNKFESPARAVTSYLSGDLELEVLEVASLAYTVLLFLFILGGYGIIIGHLGSTEVPMVIRELDGEWAECITAGKAPTNPEAWKTFGGVFGLAAIFVGMHFINYPPVPGWYLAIALLVYPVFLSSYRASIVRPTSQLQRKYCIWYDVLATRAFLRNHALLALCNILGLYDVEFFTLELLDIVNISSVIGDIIKSVTSPGKALLFTLYLFIITSIIYASFGMAHFSDQLEVPTEVANSTEIGVDEDSRRLADFGGGGGDPGLEYEELGLHGRVLKSKSGNSKNDVVEDTEVCTTLLQCTLFIFYQGMSEEGNLKDILRTASPGTYNYIPRIIYDSVFLIWVGIVIVNIITGLMVDTFSAIRGEKAQRAETLETDCFVCGMQRSAYDDLGLKPGSPTFQGHLTDDHNLWTYVYFLAYLKEKDPTEYNGIESYVKGEIDKMSLEWVPSRTSFVAEDQGKTGGDGTADAAAAAQSQADKVDAVAAALKASDRKMNAILSQLAALQKSLGALTAP